MPQVSSTLKCLYCTIFILKDQDSNLQTHSNTLAWKLPWTEEPGRLQSMGSLRVGHEWATSLSLSTFMHWRRKWQPTPVFLPGESQGRGSLVGCHLWGRTELDMTEATYQQQFINRGRNEKGVCLPDQNRRHDAAERKIIESLIERCRREPFGSDLIRTTSRLTGIGWQRQSGDITEARQPRLAWSAGDGLIRFLSLGCPLKWGNRNNISYS